MSPIGVRLWRGGLRPLLVLLARGNVLIALSVAVSAWLVQVLAGLPADPLPPQLLFLSFFSIYSLDRVTELDADGLTHPERARFSQRYAWWIRGAALGAYGLALVLAGRRGAGCLAVTLLPLLALLLYSFPFLPPAMARRVGFRRIKEVFVLKNVWVAGTLSATPVLLVAVTRRGARAGLLLALGVFLLGRWWVNVTLFDVRDEAGDEAQGLRTVPVVLGRQRTLHLLQGCNALLALLALAVPLLGLAPPTFALLGLSCLYAGAYLRRVAHARDLHFLCDVVSDGELLVLASGVLLATRLLGS